NRPNYLVNNCLPASYHAQSHVLTKSFDSSSKLVIGIVTETPENKKSAAARIRRIVEFMSLKTFSGREASAPPFHAWVGFDDGNILDITGPIYLEKASPLGKKYYFDKSPIKDKFYFIPV
ncbi:hypothetical protein, partial [Vibrio parahaemolyticus]